jgi:ketosteroid isomerase-like protein
MPNRRILILSFICCLPLASVPQQASPEIQKILALEQKWTDAYRVRNIQVMTSMLHEDFVITVEDGTVYGKVGYMSHTMDTATQVELADESNLKVHMHGNVAVVTGAYHEVGSSQGKRYEYRDRLTDIWMKSGSEWQLIAAQYSVPLPK